MNRAALIAAFAAAVADQQAGRLDDAERRLTAILAAVPDHPETLYFLGLVESEQGRFAPAADHIERAIALAPSNTLFHHQIYEIYRRLGRTDAALAAAHRAIASHPGETMILANLAAIHRDRLELDAAIACAEQAIARQPDLAEAHFALAEACLLGGDYPRGLAEYEWRWGIHGAGRLMTPSGLPAWDGGPLPAGRLLIVADQGFGDIIMFARFLPWAVARCAAIAMVCAPEMHRVIAGIAPAIVLFGRWDAPDAAAYCALSSLPHLAGSTLATVRRDGPYVHAAPAGLIAAPGGLRVGIAWAGSAEHRNDGNRSTTLATLAPLGALAGVTLVSLQKGPAQAEIAQYCGSAELIDGGSMVQDFLDTAGLIAELDLVIAVDTSVAHLAGAMGKPVWILLAHVPDWRWLLGREDTPWYPSARLFRQAAPGGWEHVIAGVVTEVRKARALPWTRQGQRPLDPFT